MLEELVEKIRKGDKQAIARSMSILENDSSQAHELMHFLHPHTGRAYRIGVTGPPGAGKSTLNAQLIRKLRQKGKSVGVVAVDPTSPFSGGAVLGDRIRMVEFTTDPKVFIRSMASRGSMGGLAKHAQDIADVLDAAGKDFILFETVGVGQTELDIAEAADTTVVVLVPESGDSIQAMKAGLMEIADVLVINKSDREGADRLRMELEMMIQLRPGEKRGWEPPIVNTTANRGLGIDDLLVNIDAHRNFLKKHQLLKEKRLQRTVHKIRELVQVELQERFWTERRQRVFDRNIKKVLANKLSPYELVEMLLNDKSL